MMTKELSPDDAMIDFIWIPLFSYGIRPSE
jgi:hypothetical protein